MIFEGQPEVNSVFKLTETLVHAYNAAAVVADMSSPAALNAGKDSIIVHHSHK
jgi:hypothetical protein